MRWWRARSREERYPAYLSGRTGGCSLSSTCGVRAEEWPSCASAWAVLSKIVDMGFQERTIHSVHEKGQEEATVLKVKGKDSEVTSKEYGV
jgi:hypothetical protein